MSNEVKLGERWTFDNAKGVGVVIRVDEHSATLELEGEATRMWNMALDRGRPLTGTTWRRLPAQSPEGPRVAVCGKSIKGTIARCAMDKGHDGECDLVRGLPAPAVPTGTPAKPKCIECGEPGNFPLRRTPKLRNPRPWCEVCWTLRETRIAADTLALETNRVEPPLPRDHWRPAIEALGAVRPFGRPRGQR